MHNDTLTQYTLLHELRKLNREQAATSTILHLDVHTVATQLDADVEYVRGILNELLTMGLAESYAATFGHPADSGRCRITAAGLQALAQLEVQLRQQQPAEPPATNPVGFQPSDSDS